METKPEIPDAIAQAKAAQAPPPSSTVADVATVVKVPTIEQLPPKTAWQTFLGDIHVNGSGLFMFACGTAAIFFPEYKDKLNELTVLAGTYLFASSKAKN